MGRKIRYIFVKQLLSSKNFDLKKLMSLSVTVVSYQTFFEVGKKRGVPSTGWGGGVEEKVDSWKIYWDVPFSESKELVLPCLVFCWD
jgi:hypothetical protein